MKIPLHAISRLRMSTDGTGIRTLILVHGCPLRCKYCINPLSWDEHRIPLELTTEELYDRIKIDDLYFRTTGGGITFGGGEPALYADFIAEFAEKYGKNWKIDIETSLNVKAENVRAMIPVVNHFFVDIKSWNPVTYEKYTGLSQKQTYDNLMMLSKECSEKVTVRIPFIPGYNTREEQKETAAVMRGYGMKVDIFDYTVKGQ